MTYGGSLAQAGRGSTLSIGSSPVLIGEVKDVPLNRGKWSVVDVTNFESGSDSEQLTTIRKPGSLTFKGNRVSSDAGQVAVETAYQAGTLVAFVLQLPKTAAQTTAGDKYAFSAFVVGSDFTDSVEQAVEFSIELNISGGCTLTVGS
jgi:hypothetical protein